MTSTKGYTRRTLDDAIYAELTTAGASALVSLDDWEAFRARARAEGLPDPGNLSEAELFDLLTRIEEAARVVLEQPFAVEFRTYGADVFEAFDECDVVAGAEPPYNDDWPVLAVDEASGDVAASIPRELVPYLAALRLRVGAQVLPLAPEWTSGVAPRHFPQLYIEPAVLETEPRSTSGTGAASAPPIARGHLSAELARSLLTTLTTRRAP